MRADTRSVVFRRTAMICFLAFAAPGAGALGAEPAPWDEACVLGLVESAAPDVTVAQLRERCKRTAEPSTKPETANQQITASPAASDAANPASQREFTIFSHKPNYFLVGAWNRRGWDSSLFQEQSGNPDYENDDVESQFQISLKVPLAIGLFGGRMDVFGAYTNRSFWQTYNDENSRPFRETNHEPEIWAEFSNDWRVAGFTNTDNEFGIVHQSNGRGGKLSRSWNRAYARFVFERGNFAMALKPWVWLENDRKGSDNPDITEYLGHGELHLGYQRRGHVFTLMTRNHLESGFDRGALELSWSFPLFRYPYLKGYLQYFNGYGESLIDYDNRVNRIGLGISLTDWLD